MSKNVAKLISKRRISSNIPKYQNLWTTEKVVISPYKKMEIPKTNIVEYTFQTLGMWSQKTAVVCGITSHSYTYHEIYKYSRNFAAQLRSKLKIQCDDEVIIMLRNSIDYPIIVLGVLQAGALVITENPSYTTHEFLRTLLTTNAKVIITHPETVSTVKIALQQAKREMPIITVEEKSTPLPPGTISYQELVKDANIDCSVLKGVNRTGNDVAFLPFSSGTTGIPKQVELTNININVTTINQNIDEIKQYRETTSTHQDSVMAVLPFFHIYGLTILLLHKLSTGAKLVVLPNFHPITFLTAMKTQKISIIYAAPPLVTFLGSNPDVKKEHMKSVQNLICGAAPTSQNEINKCYEKSRHDLKVSQLYGSTESTLIAASKPMSHNVGHVLSNTEMKIVDENGNNLGPHETGELLVKGPQIMHRYRNNPEATNSTIVAGGWLKTGDVASIELDGSLNIIDRLKELIKVKGYSVAPVEIENVLIEHPDILDAAVVGVPNATNGEALKAFVVLKDGKKVEEQIIKGFVEKRVVKYKQLRDVTILNKLPRSSTGKLLRKDLKAKYCF